MELFRGKKVIIPRSKNWKLIDETDKYSKKQRLKCKTPSGKECTLYPFPAGMEVLKIFKPLNWLDPTAGWGDRLRCAIEYGCNYTGIDSNTDMEQPYKNIIKDKASDPSKYKIKIGRFQSVRLYEKYDLVFTSPPFYTKEIYNNMVEWKSIKEFMTEFLKPLIKKSAKYLLQNGHLVLYIEDTNTEEFIPLMKEYALTQELFYEGAFYYEGSGGLLKPYYVWLKK